ncbi:hypothetical protein BGZ61DRAFT_95827 [Ilyonectria robusta]|uniref:uncharacterized protein n=1 Tax=Ilyonectria robusta TaxID=1079257 RepID=UPI001E8CCB8E|nr:uncharacterized protein BGZ61DRAFT_95827 [Ilyonectria robusta]KAH8736519.1 hypothetical protein BGZ61DRAFT_95827 [Ilyonectria robusta]
MMGVGCAVAAAGMLLGAEPIASEAASYQRFQIALEAMDPMRNARRWSKRTRHARDTRSFGRFLRECVCATLLRRAAHWARWTHRHTQVTRSISCRVVPGWKPHGSPMRDAAFGPVADAGPAPEALPTDGVTNHQRPTAWMRCRMGAAAATICHFLQLVSSFVVCSRPLFAHSGKRQCGQGGRICATPSR